VRELTERVLFAALSSGPNVSGADHPGGAASGRNFQLRLLLVDGCLDRGVCLVTSTQDRGETSNDLNEIALRKGASHVSPSGA
jgi:hypothetical protein